MNDGYSYQIMIAIVIASVSMSAYFFWKYQKMKAEQVTEADIMTMVNEGHEQGVLERSEAEMITNIFELDDKEAGDIMTNRKHMIALDGSMTVGEAADFVLREGNNSRYPVYGKDLDDITGTIHIRDLLVYADSLEHKAHILSEVPGLLREPRFIPETKSIGDLFQEMQSLKAHMEIVIDEYGQTAGLVTMEDILEEIVGNILDEYDVDEEFIMPLEDDRYLMRGLTPLDEVESVLQITFPDEDHDTYDTLNGLLISKLGRIPQEGEQPVVEYMNFQFEILHMENKRIDSLKVTPQTVLDTAEETEGGFPYLESAASIET